MAACKHQVFNKTPFVLACIAVFSLLLGGCSGKGEGDKALSRNRKIKFPVVARVGNISITVSDVKSYLVDKQVSYHYPVSQESIKKRLDEIILEEVLYQEALRLKFDQDPKVQERIRQMLTQKLMDLQINQKVWTGQIKENELKEYYTLHQDEFNRPEQIRLADIFIAVTPDITDEEQFEKRKKAESAMVEAFKMREKRSGFSRLIKKYSDTHKKYPLGDTGYFDFKGDPVGIDETLAREAFQLKGIGSISDHLIETHDGYHVIMLVGKRSALHREFDEVKGQIERQIRQEELQKAKKTYIEHLKDKADIRIDQKSMAKMIRELNETANKQQTTENQEATEQGITDTPPHLPEGGQGNE